MAHAVAGAALACVPWPSYYLVAAVGQSSLEASRSIEQVLLPRPSVRVRPSLSLLLPSSVERRRGRRKGEPVLGDHVEDRPRRQMRHVH